MKVRLVSQISGTRDGVSWPPAGSVVELPDDEAQSMLYAGTAKAVDDGDEPDAVLTVPADVEKAEEKFIPETARHEPAVGLENIPEEDRRPNMDAIGLADDGSIGHGPSNPPEALQVKGTDGEPVNMEAEASALTTDNGPTRSRRAPTKKTTGGKTE